MLLWQEAFGALTVKCENVKIITVNADMAELADATVLGAVGRPCRFKSCYPQAKGA